MKKKLNVPKFKSDSQERAFWAKLDLSAHFGPKDFVRATFPNLKPTSRAISLRLPEYLIARIKEHANEMDVPYQSLIKKYIAQGITNRR